MDGRLEGWELQAWAVGPFHVETFRSGASMVADSAGRNALHKGGAVFTDIQTARRLADILNG